MAPRQRFIHPEIWDDPDLGRVSPIAFILYIGCFSNADDDGRMIADPSHLKSQVFRYRPEVTLAQVVEATSELEHACRSFVVYDKKNIKYLCFLNWETYQKPKYPKPSKLPPPPGWKHPKPAKISQNPSPNDSPNDSRNDSPNDSPNASATGLGRVGLGLKAVESPLETGAKSTTTNGLPFSQELQITKIMGHIGTHADPQTETTLRKYAIHLPEASLTKALESSITAKPTNRAAYIIGALKSETGAVVVTLHTPSRAHTPTPMPEPPPEENP